MGDDPAHGVPVELVRLRRDAEVAAVPPRRRAGWTTPASAAARHLGERRPLRPAQGCPAPDRALVQHEGGTPPRLPARRHRRGGARSCWRALEPLLAAGVDPAGLAPGSTTRAALLGGAGRTWRHATPRSCPSCSTPRSPWPSGLARRRADPASARRRSVGAGWSPTATPSSVPFPARRRCAACRCGLGRGRPCDHVEALGASHVDGLMRPSADVDVTQGAARGRHDEHDVGGLFGPSGQRGIAVTGTAVVAVGLAVLYAVQRRALEGAIVEGNAPTCASLGRSTTPATLTAATANRRVRLTLTCTDPSGAVERPAVERALEGRGRGRAAEDEPLLRLEDDGAVLGSLLDGRSRRGRERSRTLCRRRRSSSC